MVKTECYYSLSSCDFMRDDWNALVRADAVNLQGVDGTSTFEWFEAIASAFPEAEVSRVVVAHEADVILGVLPLVIDQSSRLGARLVAPTELYGGRNAPLLYSNDPAILCAMLGALDAACQGWMSLQLTLVANGEAERTLVEACKQLSLQTTCGAEQLSPYFPILDNADEFLRGVSSDLRYRLKISARKLAEAGVIAYRKFTHEDQAQELMENVLAIERQSWKHEAGTAITNIPRQQDFYRELFPRALRSGLLSALVITLDERPIAYNFGVTHCGVFCSLKISQVEDLEKFSPSHLLNLELINQLRLSGVRSYDCTGSSEPHKLKWSNSSRHYSRRQWLVFNRSAKGQFSFLSHQLRTSSKSARNEKTDVVSGAI